jgi:hypothetical protein
MDLNAELTRLGDGTAVVSKREASLKAVKQLLRANNVVAGLNAGAYEIVPSGSTEGSGASASEPVDWEWVLVRVRRVIDVLILGGEVGSSAGGGGGGRSAGRGGGAKRSDSVSQLVLDIFDIAVRHTHALPLAENAGRAKLLPHLPFALSVCESRIRGTDAVCAGAGYTTSGG